MRKIISKVKAALKLFVLIFLFNLSRFFIPENSILIKWRPNIPNRKGKSKLIIDGKKEVIFNFKNELRNTSNKEIPTKKDPKYKLLCRLSFEGFNKFNVLIIFLQLQFWRYTNS